MVFRAVKGVILDDSVLFFNPDDNGTLSFQPAADSLLRKLRYSMLRTGISSRLGLSDCKAIIKKKAESHTIDYFKLNAVLTADDINEIMLSWGDICSSIVYVISSDRKDDIDQLLRHGWLVIVLNVGDGSACENMDMICINKLEELPLSICRLNRRAIDNSLRVVGYTMKPSREDDFVKRGAFPLYPTENGLMFMPLTFELLPSQLPEVDMILHKATDEILSVELRNSSKPSNKITYTSRMQELQRYFEEHPDLCVIDPLNNIQPVLDRLDIQKVLLGLGDLKPECGCIIRGPHFLKVDNFDDASFVQSLSEAQLSFPCIVKPQVACGVSDAHKMAIIFKVEDLRNLDVPLPAIIQEYVNHSSTLYKFYVLGEKVFYAVKKSTPNVDGLIKLSKTNKLGPLLFDSLKSLPIDAESKHFGSENRSNEKNRDLNLGLVTNSASWLRRKLDLTIFGFDVVVEEGSGDHVIVDVNFLPSFKEVPDDIAIPAFWEAINNKYETFKKTSSAAGK